MLNTLTMRQMREVQRVLGLAANELEQDAFGLQAAIAWQVKKVTDKDFTFENALDLTAEEVATILGVDADAPFTEK